MANLAHFHYEFFEQGGFDPGATRSYVIGPWPWNQSAVVVSAHPFDAPGQDRALDVTEVRRRTTPDQFLEFTVRNVGRDRALIWYVEIGLISP
ncbi:hypothetical protein [Streptomyces sp. NPDC048340]|uniref:hypothetical protein n=1 Tax=Streptomyces sp. NPDC048340 TaxID=3365537 RepID=UPI00371A5580